MSSEPAAVPAPDGTLAAAVRHVWSRLEREAAPVSLFCVAAALTVLMLPHQLLLDGWLTLVSGREVVTGGLPTVDTLTVWTHGAPWVDQQWLAQAALLRARSRGRAAARHARATPRSSPPRSRSSLVAARSLGGSPRNVGLVGTAAVLVAPWAIQMRTQSLVMPLFALLLWLLAADSRSPSRRIFLVFPLLVLWANLHGTVVLAALFVALRGVVYAFERRPLTRRRLHPRALRVRLRLAVRTRSRGLLREPLPRAVDPPDRAGVGGEHGVRLDGRLLRRRRRDARAPGEAAPAPDPVRAGSPCSPRSSRERPRSAA